jgi:HPt (histidine-containing phosphotransfer) domain-containing protein
MPGTPPPNDAIAELVRVLSDPDTRELVRMYLEEFPKTIDALTHGPAKDHMRLAHSMKSSSQYMGADGLAARFAAIEQRLGVSGEKIVPTDLEAIASDFAEIEGPLRAFAEG